MIDVTDPSSSFGTREVIVAKTRISLKLAVMALSVRLEIVPERKVLVVKKCRGYEFVVTYAVVLLATPPS